VRHRKRHIGPRIRFDPRRTESELSAVRPLFNEIASAI
jgi:hypothetical protein